MEKDCFVFGRLFLGDSFFLRAVCCFAESISHRMKQVSPIDVAL